MIPGEDPKLTVRAFLEAMNDEDYARAQTYATEDLVFEGVLGKRNGAAAYFDDMKNMNLKYDIQQIMSAGNDVAVFYHIDMGRAKIFCAGWYHLKGGAISSIKVVFDPRPLLNDAAKK